VVDFLPPYPDRATIDSRLVRQGSGNERLGYTLLEQHTTENRNTTTRRVNRFIRNVLMSVLAEPALAFLQPFFHLGSGFVVRRFRVFTDDDDVIQHVAVKEHTSEVVSGTSV